MSVVSFVVQMLMAFRANVDKARTSDGATPLFISAENGDNNTMAVRFLDEMQYEIHSSQVFALHCFLCLMTLPVLRAHSLHALSVVMFVF